MGKRIKSVALLCVILSLIYTQHSAISYAETDVGKQTEGGKSENIEGEGGNKEPEKPEKPEGEDGDKEPEKPEKPEGEDGDKEPEKPEKPEGEDGDKEPEKPEKPEGEDGDKEPEKPEKPEGEDGDKEPEKPEKPMIKKFSVKVPKAAGNSGYYTEKPDIQIVHNSECGVTKYYLKKGEQFWVRGSIKEKGRKAEISGERLEDGEYVLVVWMEDDAKKRLEEMTLEKTLKIDSREPDVQMHVQGGFDAWHKGAVKLYAEGTDAYSGVKKLSCYVNGAFVGDIKGAKGSFEITESSVLGNGVEVMVVAEDRAGKESSRIKNLYIDNIAPEAEIGGAKDYMITGKPLNITYKVQDENILSEFAARIKREDEKGRKSLLLAPDWQKTKSGRKTVQKLTQDGIYRLSVFAIDKSGQKTEKNMQVIIDRENPVIRGIEELDGRHLKSFCWDIPAEDTVQDFTTYTYEILLNGKPYHRGEKVTVERDHVLEVRAKDAAGNRAKAQARFKVDHTAPEIRFMDVEEGEAYEEKCTVKVGLRNAEDTIQRVQINGEDQKIHPRSQTCRYTVQEHQDYEIKVTAVDRAGNCSEKSVSFTVMPKKTLIQKIAEPVIKTFTGETKVKEKTDAEEPETSKQTLPIKKTVVTVAAVMCLLAVAGGLCYRREHEEEEEEEL